MYILKSSRGMIVYRISQIYLTMILTDHPPLPRACHRSGDEWSSLRKLHLNKGVWLEASSTSKGEQQRSVDRIRKSSQVGKKDSKP